MQQNGLQKEEISNKSSLIEEEVPKFESPKYEERKLENNNCKLSPIIMNNNSVKYDSFIFFKLFVDIFNI